MDGSLPSDDRRGTVFLQALPEYRDIRQTVRTLFADRSDVRVWVPRCGVGAEALSWAALLRPARPAKLRVFATDTGGRARISTVFKDDEVESIDEMERRSLLVRGADGWEMAPSLRGHLVCAEHDLLRDPPLGRLDAIGLMSAGPALTESPSVVEQLKRSLRVGGLLHVGDALTEADLGDGFTPVAPGLFQRLGRRGTEPIEDGEGPAPLPSDAALLAALAPPTIIVDENGLVRRRMGAVHPWLLAAHAGWPRALEDALPVGFVGVAQALIDQVRAGAEWPTAEIDGLRLRARAVPGRMVAVVFERLNGPRAQALIAENARLAAANAALRARLAQADD